MIAIHRRSDVTVVELGPEYDALDEETMNHAAAVLLEQADVCDPPRLVFDLTHTQYVGSSFIELMVRVWKRLVARGGGMAVCGANPFVQEVLHVLRLDTVWDLHGQQADAVAALSA